MTFGVHPRYKLLVRSAAAIAVAAAVVWLAVKAAVPSGVLKASTDFVRPSPFVSAPKPADRLAKSEDRSGGAAAGVLTGDPLFVDLSPPSEFDTVIMSLQYESEGNSFFEIGALSSPIDGQFDLRPARHALLDGLVWSRVSDGRLTLLQRRREYDSVREFLDRPPDRDKIGVYKADLSIPYAIAGYAPAQTGRAVAVSLRGRHRFLVYVRDEPLDFSLSVQDMNREIGGDPVILSVYREGDSEPIARSSLDDDGNASADQRSSPLRTVSAVLPNLAAGVYKIEFTAPADIFIRSFATRQRKLVLSDRLYIGDAVGYSDAVVPLAVLTDGERIEARTAHAEGAQTVIFDGRKIEIEGPGLGYSVRKQNGAGLAPLVSPKRDVLFETDGLFAFSEEAYFNPRFYSVPWYATANDLDEIGIDYILTSYAGSAGDGFIKEAQAEFSVRRLAKTKNGAYRFVITDPAVAETAEELRIVSVVFTLVREPITWRNGLRRLVRLLTPEVRPDSAVISTGRSYEESPE